MRHDPSPRRLTIGIALTWIVSLAPAVRAGGDALGPVPTLGPGTLPPRAEATDGKTFEKSALGVFVAGALFDLYTTKRALDSGLHEANPLLGRSGDRDRTLAKAAMAKIGFGFLIGSVGRRRGDRSRARWFLSCGALQMGLGLANRRAIEREREGTPTRPPPSPIPPPSDPSGPGSVVGPRPPGKAALVPLGR